MTTAANISDLDYVENYQREITWVGNGRHTLCSRQELEAAKLATVFGLQQEWMMQLELKEMSRELRALRRVNSDAEYFLQKKTLDQEKVVKGLVKRYDTSIGLSRATFNNVDRELQNEIKSLQVLESKAKKLEEEFNEILKEREKEDEKRRLRLQKIKQKFRIVARLHAYFMKPKDQSASDPLLGSSKTSKKNRSSLRIKKQQIMG